MANDFKSFSKTNIAIDSGAYSTMYTGLTGKETILLEVDIANTTAGDITTLNNAFTGTATDLVEACNKAPSKAFAIALCAALG